MFDTIREKIKDAGIDDSSNIYKLLRQLARVFRYSYKIFLWLIRGFIFMIMLIFVGVFWLFFLALMFL